MMGLTQRQARAKAFIKQHIAARGIAPTFDEIRSGLGMKSKAQVSDILTDLQERGHIRRVAGAHRSIELIDEGAPA